MKQRRARITTRPLNVEGLEERVVFNVSPYEQLAIELINRARANPVAEVRANPEVSNLNAGIPASARITTAPKQPLAPNALLQQLADDHTADMWQRRFFGHNDPNGIGIAERFDRSQYQLVSGAENVGRDTYFHPTLNADPGDARNLEQAIRKQHQQFFASPGHRRAILGEGHDEIGIGASEFSGAWNAVATADNDPIRIPAGVQFLLETQVFGSRPNTPILTGVAIDDRDGDHFYDIGEGLAGVKVRILDQDGTRVAQTETASAGGYAIELEPGTYLVRATGRGITHEQTVTIADRNFKLDFRKGTSPAAPPALAHPGPQSVGVNEPLSLQLSFVDLNPNDSHTVTMRWGDGTATSENVPNRSRTISVAHTYRNPGTYTAMFEVTDAAGHKDSANVSVRVFETDRQPSIDQITIVERRSGNASSFQFFVSDPNAGDAHTAVVHFGDGTSAQLDAPNLSAGYGFEVEHTYASPQAYDVSVRVTDSSGRSANAGREVRIRTPTSWHNARTPTDTDRRNGTTPIDALLITNELTLREHSSAENGLITNGTTSPPAWLDVNNNGYVEPVDGLLTVNALSTSSQNAALPAVAFRVDLLSEDEERRVDDDRLR